MTTTVKRIVKFSALTDMHARIEVDVPEADKDNIEAIVELARERLDPSDFDLPDEGAVPIVDSEEAYEVEDEDGEIIGTMPQASYDDIVDGMKSSDLLKFVHAVAAAFPPDASRDRFGRINGYRNTDLLRELSLKYQVGGCSYTDEQVGKVAAALLAAIGTPPGPHLGTLAIYV